MSAIQIAGQTVTVQPDHILVERPPGYEVVAQDLPQAMEALTALCEEAGCDKVLVVGPSTRVNLSAFDLFDLGKAIAKLKIRMAIAELHDATDDATGLLKVAALNRGSKVRFFDNVQDARDWLGID